MTETALDRFKALPGSAVRKIAVSLLAAVSLMLIGAAKPDVSPAPYSLLPAPGDEVQPDEDVAPGHIVARALLAGGDAVQLVAPLSLDYSSEKRRWDRYQMLDASHVPDRPDLPATVFCEWRNDGSAGKQLAGQMLFGLVGALRSTSLKTRFCLFDGDGDGMLDHAVLIGARRDSNRGAFAIPPVAVKRFPGQLIGNGSEVRLRYAGDAGTPGQVAFDIEVTVQGLTQPVPDARRTISIATLPATIDVGAARIKVVAYDPARRTANLWIDHGLAPGHISRDGVLDGD